MLGYLITSSSPNPHCLGGCAHRLIDCHKLQIIKVHSDLFHFVSNTVTDNVKCC